MLRVNYYLETYPGLNIGGYVLSLIDHHFGDFTLDTLVRPLHLRVLAASRRFLFTSVSNELYCLRNRNGGRNEACMVQHRVELGCVVRHLTT